MAPKRPSPLDEPPTASSSSSEQAEEDDEQPLPKPSSTLNSASSHSDSGSDSQHRWVANPRVKPKPIADTPNPNPKAKKPAPSPARSTTKRRPTENNVTRQASAPKRAKKTLSEVQVPPKEDHGKNGKDPHSTKPHAKKSCDGKETRNRKDQKEVGSRTVASLNSKQVEKMDTDTDKDKPCGSTMLSLSEMIRFDQTLGLPLPGLSEHVIKRGLELIGASKRAELEKRWKDLQVAELELYVQCAQLISDQAKLIWEAYKSSNH